MRKNDQPNDTQPSDDTGGGIGSKAEKEESFDQLQARLHKEQVAATKAIGEPK